MNDLENLIRMAQIVAKPWKVSVGILAVLLVASVLGNIYMATVEKEVVIEQDNDFSDFNTNGIVK